MLERDIERRVTEIAKKHGWLSFKFVSPAQRGVPDRIFMKGDALCLLSSKHQARGPPNFKTM